VRYGYVICNAVSILTGRAVYILRTPLPVLREAPPVRYAIYTHSAHVRMRSYREGWAAACLCVVRTYVCCSLVFYEQKDLAAVAQVGEESSPHCMWSLIAPHALPCAHRQLCAAIAPLPVRYTPYTVCTCMTYLTVRLMGCGYRDTSLPVGPDAN
jgi:hypothetical protein